ncbi:MAG TPA: ABC transporter ATP-binding protein [Lachnospiraceae bacterium]|nr:ABC transporter ATP-binding protein [Lachnospiraceae bacterium]
MKEALIKLKNLTYAYPEGRALDGLSAEFYPGRCYVLQGPNGCGKSTLFRILTGLDFASEGEYSFDGKKITAGVMKDRKFAKEFHRRIGFIFQNSEVQLFTGSVEDEIAFGLFQLGLPENEVRMRTDRYIRLLELEGVRTRAPFRLSGGEKKRTALAAVLSMEPEVLILDEPLSGLDEDGQEWIMHFLENAKSPGRLMLIATHQKEFAGRIADEEIFMNKYHRIERIEKMR